MFAVGGEEDKLLGVDVVENDRSVSADLTTCHEMSRRASEGDE